jgi:hypothetical protein
VNDCAIARQTGIPRCATGDADRSFDLELRVDRHAPTISPACRRRAMPIYSVCTWATDASHVTHEPGD